MSNLYFNLLNKLLLPIGDLFFRSQFDRSLKLLRQLVKKSEVELVTYQKTRLKEILENAVEKAEYYRALKIAKDENPVQWLKKFPVLDKESLRKNNQHFLTKNPSKLIKNVTSGSSGIQIEVYVTKEERSFIRAAQTIWWEWAGYTIGHPILQTGLATSRSFEKTAKDFFLRTFYLFAFGLDSKNIQKAIKWSKNRNAVVGGFTSSLFVLAELTKNENLKFKSAISWGDKLFDHYRESIEKSFQCKVFENYGASEGLMIAGQKDLEYLYIMTPAVYLEILDDDGNEVAEGEIGHVVVTSLVAEAMPLIRYKLGDLAIMLPKTKYPPQREINLPILEKVIGRETDLVITPSGKKLIVHSFTGIFEYFPEIKQFCVIQERLEGVIIEFIKSESFEPSAIEKIKSKLLKLVNEEFSIDFKEVSFIPPTKSGKPQIIISNLNKN